MQTRLYWETNWRGKTGALDTFMHGINERNLSQMMVEDNSMRLKDVDCWLLRVGILSSKSVDVVLSFHTGSQAEDSGTCFRAKFEQVQGLLEGSILEFDEACSLASLDWFVKDIIGTSFIGNRKLSVVSSSRVEGYHSGEGQMQFSTCYTK